MISIVSSLNGMRGHIGYMFELRYLKVRLWSSRKRRMSLWRGWKRVQSANMREGCSSRFMFYRVLYLYSINESTGLFTMY